ncbi:hypothetical protein SCALM49S_08978 [Streptomyces californicus]
MPTSETGSAPPGPLSPPSRGIGAAGVGGRADSRPAARVPIDRKRQSSGDEARERAMRAAMGVIAEKGVAAVRMSDIAARAGMSTGHILYHFGKKGRLLLGGTRLESGGPLGPVPGGRRPGRVPCREAGPVRPLLSAPP